MKKLTLNDLPEVFVEFKTVKAKKGKVVYNNKNLGHNLTDLEIISKYNYVTIDTSQKSDNLLDTKIFYAERYGGDGISTNGGGGRCGFDGVFHSKGLGPNQLVGDRPRDRYGNSHANGFLSLDVAIYESIWSEIINIALPYGAVRTVAVINLECDFEEPDITLPRGLLIRMPAVRPAHFIRALYFKEKKLDALSEDAKRVKLAIQKLVDFLPESNLASPAKTLDENLAYRLSELASRYAKQFAAARAKRIFHQSISASNITLDGAWMDLAGSTVFSNDMWWEGFNIKHFLMEYEPATDSIREICFYLYKYQMVTMENSNKLASLALATFNREYVKNLSIYNAAQSGFPIDILETLSDNVYFSRFSDLLNKILALDNYSVTPIKLSNGWEGYEYWRSKLYRQLLKQKLYKTKESFCWVSTNGDLLKDLTFAYDSLFDLVQHNAEIYGVNYDAFCKLVSINVTRLNRFSSVLFCLQDMIPKSRQAKSFVEQKSRYGELFERAINSAFLTYKHYTATNTLFWRDGDILIVYVAQNNRFEIHTIHGDLIDSGSFSEILEKNNTMKSATCFYVDMIEVFYE